MKIPNGWRIGQTVFNFLEWLKIEKGYSGEGRMADPFFINNGKLEVLYWEFLQSLKLEESNYEI